MVIYWRKAEAKVTTQITVQEMKRHPVSFRVIPQMATGPLQGPHTTQVPPFPMLPPWEEAFTSFRDFGAVNHNSRYIAPRSSFGK